MPHVPVSAATHSGRMNTHTTTTQSVRQPGTPVRAARGPRTGALTLGVAALLLAGAVSGCSAYGDEPSAPSPEPTPTRTPTPTPDQSQEPEVDVPAPARELVGTWNGGPGDSSDWYLTIGDDGSWTLTNDYLGLGDSGVVDTSGQGFEMYNDSGDARVVDAAGINGCQWSINRSLGMTFLYFCDGPLSSWVPVG